MKQETGMWQKRHATYSFYFKGQELEGECTETLWVWGVFSGLVFGDFLICLFCEEEISKIIQEKHDGFHLQKEKTEVVTL